MAKPLQVQSAAVALPAEAARAEQVLPAVVLQAVPEQVVQVVPEQVAPVVKAVQSAAVRRPVAQPAAELPWAEAPRVVHPQVAVRPVVRLWAVALRWVAVRPWAVVLRSVAVPRQPVVPRSAVRLPSWNRRQSVLRCSMPGRSDPCWPTPE
ncbi:hypothetical protein V4U86_08380 [Mycobacterium sp. AMU20-3851]|uniref:hypothetical protein n=1 Tax=Mycobacterium sp. AMU20-3851 TaxID=3122055 RepID=UPI003754E3EA